MVEELKEASDIKKLIGKNKGDEDPLLVAQRFLNIFRQLHIFDQQRREEFNSMILALPPETRGTFGALPGGSLLQEYVDELEISRGMQRSSSSAPQPKFATAAAAGDTKESPLTRAKNATPTTSGNITQVMTGEAKIVADANFAQVLSQSVSSALMSASASQSSNLDKIIKTLQENGGSGKIVPDEKFATSMARAFSQALQFSDANKKADIQELIKAVRESRKIELPDGFSFNNAVATPANVTNDVSFAKTIADTITKAIKPSVGVSAPASNDEMKELIKAVRESKGFDVEALSKALVNGLKPLLDNVGNQSSVKNQPLKISADSNFSEIITNALTKTFEISEKKHQEQTEKLIAGFQDVMRNDKAEKASNENKKNNQKNNPQQMMQSPFFPAQFLTPVVSDNTEKFEKITQEFTKTLRSLSDSRKSENREIAQAIKDTQKELLKLLNLQNSRETNNDTSKTLSDESIHEIIAKVAKTQANIFQELARQQTNELSTIISLALRESQKSSVETIVNTFKKFQEHNISLNLPTYSSLATQAQSDIYPKADFETDTVESNLNSSTTKKSYIQKSLEAAQQKEDAEKKEPNPTNAARNLRKNVAEYIKSEFEPLPLEEQNKPSSTDWGFDDVTTNDTTTNASFSDNLPEPTSQNDGSDDEWEWEYEEEAPYDAQGLEGQDWEWEYEEDDTSSEVQGLEGQDWEWEYEEDDDASQETQSLDGDDWEWEYEEDEEGSENVAEVLAEGNESSISLTQTTEDIPNEVSAQENTLDEEFVSDDNNLSPSDTDAQIEAKTPESTSTPKEDISSTPQVMSSADLLATFQKTPSVSTNISSSEVGIAELRNYENSPDPYVISNISV